MRGRKESDESCIRPNDHAADGRARMFGVPGAGQKFGTIDDVPLQHGNRPFNPHRAGAQHPSA
jgi:hypothetical protein